MAHQRYYTAAGELVPGVTTILGGLAKPALVPWANRLGLQGIDTNKYTDEAAMIGTLAHYLVECQLGEIEPDLVDYTPAQLERANLALGSFNAWLGGHTLKPSIVEGQLVSEKYHFGGTIDAYGLLDGVPTLLDFKTSSGIYDEHKFQTAAYWKLLAELGHPVKGVRILRISRDGGGLEEHRLSGKEVIAGWKVFAGALAVYQARKAFKKAA